MPRLSGLAVRLALAAVGLCLAFSTASAEGQYRWDWSGGDRPHLQAPAPQPVRVVPGNPFAGCWQTEAHLYRRYVVAFCASDGGRGAYRVKGDGYDCQGQSRWNVSGDGSRLVYQMDRGTCGASANWTADRIECRATRGPSLACTYHPNAPGYRVSRFSAFAH